MKSRSERIYGRHRDRIKRLLTSLVASGDVTEELPETSAHGAIQVMEILDGSRGPSARLIFTHFIILQKELAEFNRWLLPSSGKWAASVENDVFALFCSGNPAALGYNSRGGQWGVKSEQWGGG